MANPIKTYHLSNLTQTELLSLKSRPRIDFSSVFDIVTFFITLSQMGFSFSLSKSYLFAFSGQPHC